MGVRNMGAALAAAFAVLAIAGPVASQDRPEDIERIAREFVAAYESVNIDALRALSAEDLVSVDESAPASAGGPYRFEGREAWLSGLEGFVREGGLIEIRQFHDTVWQSGEKVVFIGRFDARYRDPRGGVQHVKGRIVTVIAVRNGKVVRHEDIADYPGFEILRVPDEAP